MPLGELYTGRINLHGCRSGKDTVILKHLAGHFQPWLKACKIKGPRLIVVRCDTAHLRRVFQPALERTAHTGEYDSIVLSVSRLCDLLNQFRKLADRFGDFQAQPVKYFLVVNKSGTASLPAWNPVDLISHHIGPFV